MKRETIGIVRPMGLNGRVVIPVEFRKELDIEIGDDCEIKLVNINKSKKVIEITKKKELENEQN